MMAPGYGNSGTAVCDFAHRSKQYGSILSNQRMKRVVQFAALVTIALMAGSPLAEGLVCSILMDADRAACPMEMGEMGPRCPMADLVAADKCAPECCNLTLPKLFAEMVTPAKPNSGSLHAAAAEPIPDTAAARNRTAAWFFETAATSSPPRYILNRVFRI